MYDDEDYLVKSMEVGASGYVLKDSSSAQLIAAIQVVSGSLGALLLTVSRFVVGMAADAMEAPQRPARRNARIMFSLRGRLKIIECIKLLMCVGTSDYKGRAAAPF
jgi:DNA-binding NarL/FixJ family response regulator